MEQASSGKREIVSVVLIEEQDTYAAVHRAVSLLGVPEDIIPAGSRVLIKPNLVMAPMNRGITNPVVLDAVIRLVLSCRPSEVIVAEGAADVYTSTSFRILNTYDIASRYGVRLVDLNLEPGVRREVPAPVGREYVLVPKLVTECDALVSVPTFKLWGDSPMSLSLKNMFGLYGGSYYGHNKNSREFLPEHPEYTLLGEVGSERGAHHPTTAQAIAAMNWAVRPSLTVIDAVEGGDGEGNNIRLDLVLAGTNSTATDTVALALSGFTAAELPTFALAGALGLGPNRLEDIEVRGEKIEDVRFDLRRLRDNVMELPVGECLRRLSLGELEAMTRALMAVGLAPADLPFGATRVELTSQLLTVVSKPGYYGRALERIHRPGLDLLRLIAQHGGTSGDFYSIANEFKQRTGDDYLFWPAHRSLTRLGLAYVFHGFNRSYFILPEGLLPLL